MNKLYFPTLFIFITSLKENLLRKFVKSTLGCCINSKNNHPLIANELKLKHLRYLSTYQRHILEGIQIYVHKQRFVLPSPYTLARSCYLAVPLWVATSIHNDLTLFLDIIAFNLVVEKINNNKTIYF